MQDQSNAKPLFLLVNDDGVSAPGIRVLAEEMAHLGEVIIVAPSSERSAQSQAITITSPLRLHALADNVYGVDGTPADCVMLALQYLVKRKPDWVLSGINRGGNLGTDILYSGTVGAALEASISNCRAMAISLEGIERNPNRYEVAAKITRMLIENIDALKLGQTELINLNVPNLPFEEIKGIRAAMMGRRIYEGKMHERQDPRGQRYFWIGGNGFGHDEIPGSDCVVLHQGYATVSILKPDRLNEKATERISPILSDVFDKNFKYDG